MRAAILFPVVAALAAAPLFAADAPPSAPAGGWQRPTPAEFEARRAAMEARRSADIALLLGLRADQKPALDAYLAAMHPSRDHDRRGHGADHAPGAMPVSADESTLASLDRMSRHLDARDAEAKQRIEATRRFYAGLTHEQQQRFDAMAHLMRGGFEHHGRGDHGGWEKRGAPHDMHGMG